MPKHVFIVEPLKADIDVSKASRHGDVIYLFDINARRCSVFQHDKFGRAVLARLRDVKFDPQVDCVCVVGAILTLAVSISAIAQSYDEFDLLLFNSVEGNYVRRRFRKTDWTEDLITVKGDSNEKTDAVSVECD